MDYKCNKVKLYTSQSPIVIEVLDKEKILHVRRRFIQNKYEEVSKIFLEAYDWYVCKAQNIVGKPEGAGYPVWAFTEADYAGHYPGSYLVTLEVPVEEVIFFRMKDWSKILNLSYLSLDEKDEDRFMDKLKSYNINNESDVFTKPYYPLLKAEVKKSWDNLFMYDKLIKSNLISKKILQASLWEIKSEWVIQITKA